MPHLVEPPRCPHSDFGGVGFQRFVLRLPRVCAHGNGDVADFFTGVVATPVTRFQAAFDRAAALASYPRQADDKTLENYATRIRSRAIKRAGELLKEFDGKGKRTDLQPSDGAVSAEAAGMSERQKVTAIRVANVPSGDLRTQHRVD
ncbi:hypothetical protein LZK76_11910 [Rhizobium leguminosarum]|nr:hypothetical protein LZK76_11910 [Rhizobium leguminosarum]